MNASEFFGAVGGAVVRNVWDSTKAPAFVARHDDVISPMRRMQSNMLTRGGYAGYVGGLYVFARQNQTNYFTTPNWESDNLTNRSFPAFMGSTNSIPPVGASAPGGASMVVAAQDQAGYYRIARSTDGINWTSIAGAGAGTGLAPIMLRHDGVSDYVLCANDGKLWTSPDGATWTQRTGALSLFYYDMVRVGSRRFLASSSGVYTTDDMVTFTARHSIPYGRAIAIGVCGTRIVALYAPVAINHSEHGWCQYFYSDDNGITWSAGALWQCGGITEGFNHYTKARNAPWTTYQGTEQGASCQSANAHGALVVKGVSVVATTFDSANVPSHIDNVLIVTFDGVTMYSYRTGQFSNQAGQWFGGYVSVLGTQLILSDAQSGTCSINIDAKEIAIER